MNYEITHVTGTGRYDSGGSLGENFRAKSIQLENLKLEDGRWRGKADDVTVIYSILLLIFHTLHQATSLLSKETDPISRSGPTVKQTEVLGLQDHALSVIVESSAHLKKFGSRTKAVTSGYSRALSPKLTVRW